MARKLDCQVSESVWRALQKQVAEKGYPADHLVERALASFLGVDHHTLFQVSTIGALAKGIFQGCVRVSDVKEHGDFGLGTFAGLDGEMILLDGHCYQALDGGVVHEAADDSILPFGVSTNFCADQSEHLADVADYADLISQIDAFRPSENLFVGIRIDGVFEFLKMRTACKANPGEDLLAATKHQSVFSNTRIEGTIVGFWTPEYARTINVAGYHLHFISSDRKIAGHILEVQATDLDLSLHLETEFNMIIPETGDFLTADLTGDPTADLSKAER